MQRNVITGMETHITRKGDNGDTTAYTTRPSNSSRKIVDAGPGCQSASGNMYWYILAMD